MQVTSVNVGIKRTQPKAGGLETTGIYKLPTTDPVKITSLGLQDDFVCDQKNHGGPDQAVFLYSEPDYASWARQLGRQLSPGTFGENLTVSELESARFNIGDRLYVGSTVLEVTAPRIPCATLARRMGDPLFVRAYTHAERPGLYCRVLQEGTVRVGDPVRVEPYAGDPVSALEVFREHLRRDKDEAALRRILLAPIAVRERADIERDLRKLLANH